VVFTLAPRGARQIAPHAARSVFRNTAILKKERTMKRIIPVLLLALCTAGSLTACNTVAGAGKDMQGAGEAVHDTAQDCKDGKC